MQLTQIEKTFPITSENIFKGKFKPFRYKRENAVPHFERLAPAGNFTLALGEIKYLLLTVCISQPSVTPALPSILPRNPIKTASFKPT